MKRCLLSILIACCLTLLITVQAQSLQIDHFTVADGISQSVINCIYQDSEGFIWFGTQNGLNKFDGYKFQKYFAIPGDSSSLPHNWIYSIAEDPQNRLIVGTRGGLVAFSRRSGNFSRISYKNQNSEIEDPFVYGVISDHSNIYVNIPPVLSVIDSQTGSFKNYTNAFAYEGGLYDGSFPIICTKDGMIWIGSLDGLHSFDPGKGEFSNYRHKPDDPLSISSNHVTAIFEGRNGLLWIGTEDGLNVIDRDSNMIRRYFQNPGDLSGLSNGFIRSIIEDENGYLWVGTEGGGLNKLHIKDDCEGKLYIESFRSGLDLNYSLSHDIVESLLLDRSNNLWVGTLAGLDKTDLKKKQIQKFSKTDDALTPNLLDDVIAAIYQDDEKHLWIGTWGKGLNILDRKNNQLTYYTVDSEANKIPENHVHVIFEDHESRIWLGTRDGLVIFNSLTSSFIPVADYFNAASFNQFRDTRIYCIEEAERGKIWIGTGKGVIILDTNKLTTSFLTSGASEDLNISSNLVYSILKDKNGDIWIGTSGGLDRYQPESGEIIHYRKNNNSANSLVDNFIISLAEDREGNIWIGTGVGVNCLDPGNSTFRYYSVNDGLPSNVIYNILEDIQGNLWFASGSGVAWANPLNESIEFHEIDELKGLEFNLKAVYCAEDGELFFGGMEGLYTFYPDSLQSNSYVPPVYITSFEKERDGVRESLNVYQPETKLSYKDYSFTIEFSALDYTAPRKNRFSYLMEGISENWHYIGERNFVHFTNLSPGEYVFHVKGTNNDGIWNETPTSLEIIIAPPWWRSRLAYAAYGVLLVVLIFLIIRIRERQLIKEKRVLEEKVRSRTVEIALQKERLEESEEKLRSTINSLDDLVYVLDNEGIFREFYNPHDQDVNYRNPESYLTKHYNEVGLPEPIKIEFKRILEKLRSTDEVQEFDYYFGTGNKMQCYNARVSPRRNSPGNLTGVVVVSRNITDRKRAEELLRMQKEELKELNATKDRFFSILAHDLKNPFTNLYSLSELIIRNYGELDEEEKVQALKNINKSAEFIYVLLENLLTWSRIQRGSIKYTPGIFNFSKLADVNLNLYKSEADRKGIEFQNHLKEELKVFGDREMIDTVLRNLISNAVKFTASGGKIELLAERGNGSVVVKVKDEGIGIPKNDISKLFQIDEKYKSTGTAGEKGTGLGLVLCREFVEKNGGRIWCDSVEGEGSVFYFTLPVDEQNPNNR